MNQRTVPLPHSFFSKANWFRLSIMVAFTAFVILPLFFVSSASLSHKSLDTASVGKSNQVSSTVVGRAAIPSNITAPSLFTWMPQGPLPESVATFDATCATPKTTFAVGETACAKAEGTLFGSYSLYWVDSQGNAVQTDIVSDTNPTATWVVTASGNWKAYLSADSLRASALFKGSDANAAAVDLTVSNTAIGTSSFVSDGFITYEVWVLNNGPDDAADVSLVQAIPNNAVREQQSQDSGPIFACTDNTLDTTCTISSLASGASAYFTFIYKLNNGVTVGSLITSSSTVTSSTTELHAPDNSSTTESTVVAGAAGATCTLDCPGNITTVANTTFNGNSGAIVTFSTAEGVGSCGEISSSTPSGSFFPLGTTTVVVTSTIGGGGCSFDVTVVAGGAPTISCPANQTVTAASGATEATVDPGTPTTNPTSGVSVSGLRSDNELLTDPYPIGTTFITWTVTDSVGLSANCTQSITVNSSNCATDNENPTITAPANVTVDTPAGIVGSCGLVVGESQLGTPDVTDNCTVNVVRTGVPAGNFFPAGTTTITYTATDGAGNTATATQTVTVNDKSAPIIAAPADASYVCPSEVPAAHPSQATRGEVLDENGNPLPPGPPVDNCGIPVVTVSETSTGVGSAANPKIITRTFTATDAAGNSASAVQTITVADGVAPTITAPADASYQCAGEVPAANASAATASDNCAAPTVTVSDANNGGAGTTASPLIITRTFTATDAAGNTAQDAQTITVIDNTAPVISCPSDITVHLPLNTPATSMAVNFSVSATDNCAGSPTVTTSVPSGHIFPVGTTIVTATATDAAGNSSTCNFNVTVLYNFTGFFAPVSNLPTINEMKAGQAVPTKFSLSGNKGLNIFAAQSPNSVLIACDSGAPVSPVEETVTAGSSSLTYDATSDRYHYVWKTESGWKNTCRQLNVVLNDGSTHSAKFKFK